MQDQIETFFKDYGEALSKGDIGRITDFYAPTFVIEKDNQEITTSNNTAFKASLWLRDFLTKWNDEISMEAEDVLLQGTNDNEYVVKVHWSIRNAEGKERKQQEVIYTLKDEGGLRIIASSV